MPRGCVSSLAGVAPPARTPRGRPPLPTVSGFRASDEELPPHPSCGSQPPPSCVSCGSHVAAPPTGSPCVRGARTPVRGVCTWFLVPLLVHWQLLKHAAPKAETRGPHFVVMDSMLYAWVSPVCCVRLASSRCLSAADSAQHVRTLLCLSTRARCRSAPARASPPPAEARGPAHAGCPDPEAYSRETSTSTKGHHVTCRSPRSARGLHPPSRGQSRCVAPARALRT